MAENIIQVKDLYDLFHKLPRNHDPHWLFGLVMLALMYQYHLQ